MTRTILNSCTQTETGNELITLSEVKSYLGISTSVHDTLLAILLESARQEVGLYIKQALVTTSVEAQFESVNEYFNLPVIPLQGSITVVDMDNASVSFTVGGGNNPKVKLTSKDPIKVTYTAGYGSLSDNLKMIVIKKVGEDFEFRTGITLTTSNLLPNNWRESALKYRNSWLM